MTVDDVTRRAERQRDVEVGVQKFRGIVDAVLSGAVHEGVFRFDVGQKGVYVLLRPGPGK